MKAIADYLSKNETCQKKKKNETSCVGFVFHIEKFGNACCKELIKINIVRNRFLFLYHVSSSYFFKKNFCGCQKI